MTGYQPPKPDPREIRPTPTLNTGTAVFLLGMVLAVGAIAFTAVWLIRLAKVAAAVIPHV
jgi:hypothetical protein